MNSKQRKALEAKAQKKIKAIMRKHPLFRDAIIAITFKAKG
jgi:predicted nucleic acid-binding protein